MLNYVDWILLALVAFFVITGIRKGFARTLLSFVARVTSLVVAYFISDMYAESVYERLFKDVVSNAIESNIDSSASIGVSEQLHTVLSKFPQIVTSIGDNLGLDALINQQVDDSGFAEGVSTALEESVAGPLAVAVCKIILFAIVSAIASFVLAILVNLLCKIVKLPILKTADKLLGAGLGLVNGLICVFILSFIFTIASGFINPPELADAINSSYIIDFFAYANMLV